MGHGMVSTYATQGPVRTLLSNYLIPRAHGAPKPVTFRVPSRARGSGNAKMSRRVINFKGTASSS